MQASDWISVEDKLPSVQYINPLICEEVFSETVLIYSGDITGVGYYSSAGYWYIPHSKLPIEVTHWMPIVLPGD